MITAVCMLALDHFGLVEMPPELLMIIPILLFLFMSFERMIPKLFRMGVSRIQPMEKSDPRVPTLVYGAGEAGNYLIENVRLNHARTVKLVGYIDDNERRSGASMYSAAESFWKSLSGNTPYGRLSSQFHPPPPILSGAYFAGAAQWGLSSSGMERWTM